MTEPVRIQFSRPHKSANELVYLAEAVNSSQLAGGGSFTRRCEALLSPLVGDGKVLLTNSCTSALEMAAMLIGIGPQDEVILPSFTFSSTASSVSRCGGKPVFVDVLPSTLTMDPDRVEAAVTDATRAIFVVHYAGVVADMEPILGIAGRHNLYVVEDAAQALGSFYRGQPAGAFGDLAAFSFHDTKNVSCGEGGCLVINRPELVQSAEVIREKGTNRTAFYRGEVDRYTWVDIGSSFLPSELNAAVLLAQLEDVDVITSTRLALWQRYREALGSLGNQCGFDLAKVPADRTSNGHMFYAIFRRQDDQSRFIAKMRAEGITTPFHYVPLHSSPAGLKYGRTAGPMTVTDTVWNRLVRLPLHTQLGSDIEIVIDAVKQWPSNHQPAKPTA